MKNLSPFFKFVSAALLGMLVNAPLVRAQSVGVDANYSQVRAKHQSSFTKVLDHRGELLAQVRSDHQALRLDWVALEDVSPALIQMVLASEDKRFIEHAGVDFAAVMAALKQNLAKHVKSPRDGKGSSARARGASTITMQLVGLLGDDLRPGAQGRSLIQKFGQAGAALWLEQSWTKAQILEAYLNLVPMPGELVGMPAASRALFGKAAHALNREESALLAALLRGPNAPVLQVSKRACSLLELASCELLEGAARIALSQAKRPQMTPPPLAPHFARHVIKQEIGVAKKGSPRGPLSEPSNPPSKAAPHAPLVTSLDAQLQGVAQHVLLSHLHELSRRQVEDGAVLVLDRKSGQPLAWVGSSGTLSDAAQVDYVLAKRQAGSTLKPFLFARAIEERRLTAASLLDDSPVNLATAAGLYVPRNYEQNYLGPVTVRSALGASLNIPAVRTAVMLGPDKLFQTLRDFGFGLRESGSYFGHSLALGAAEVSLLELAQAYRQLADTSSPIGQGQNQISVASKFIVRDILADNNARALTFGLSSPLATKGWAMVKTGTSKDMRDNWCVGVTDRFVVAVWVGNASGEAMHNVSGITGAAPVWAELVRELHRHQVSREPTDRPKGLVQSQVRFEGLALAQRDEWFLIGTQRELVSAVQHAAPAHAQIQYPVNGTILALDPDIPPSNQRLRLRAQLGELSKELKSQLSWRLDGKQIAQADVKGEALWFPEPGKHWLSLHDRSGQMLDKVSIEVRGAQARLKAAK